MKKKKDPRNGLWYWMTMANQSNYWIGKALGGEAEKEADAAMTDIGLVFAVVFILVIVGVIVFFILRGLRVL